MEQDLHVHDFSKKLEPFLSAEVIKALSNEVKTLLEFPIYEVKYVQVVFKEEDEENALKEMARKLDAIYKKYGIYGALAGVLSFQLLGPEGVLSPKSLDWDYEKNPIGPGTVGWGKTAEEIERFRNRRILLVYPAIPWDSLFTPEGVMCLPMEAEF